MDLPIKVVNSSFQEWIRFKIKIEEWLDKTNRIVITKIQGREMEEDSLRILIMIHKVKQQMVLRFKKRNSITSFISIVLKRQLIWWESSIKLLRLWDLMNQLMVNSKMKGDWVFISRIHSLNLHLKVFYQILDIILIEKARQLFQTTEIQKGF